MVYFVTGANLFGQWPWSDFFISEFRSLAEKNIETLNRADLVQITWSYNILEIGGSFYIAGRLEKQLDKINLPLEFGDEDIKLLAAGNDNNVILVDKKTNNIWILNLEDKKDIKRLNLDVESPVNKEIKKAKLDDNIVKVSVNGDSCLYLTTRGHVYQGILPSYVDTSHCNGKVVDIQCGFEHFVLLTDVGALYTWGTGRRLQLGHGDVSNLELPTEVEALAGIKIIKIICGGWHTLALSESGDGYVWGWNNFGQLGIKQLNKETESLSIPTPIDLFDDEGNDVLLNIKDIACGNRHSAIILDDNSVWTAGFNKYGQLGVSNEKYPVVNNFKKVFQCNNDCHLLCGPWTTVIKE